MDLVNAPLDDQERAARQRKRSIAIGLALAAFAIIFYVLTIAKLGPAVFDRPL